MVTSYSADPEMNALYFAGRELQSRAAPLLRVIEAVGDKVPTLAPPIYGEFPAKRHKVDPALVNSRWLDGLSLQPRYRLAAGWGAGCTIFFLGFQIWAYSISRYSGVEKCSGCALI